MHLFIRLTLTVALAVAAFIALLFLLKIIVFAAVVAALVLAGIYIFNFCRSFSRIRRNQLPAQQYAPRDVTVH